MLHTTSSFYSLNPNIHHTIEDHEGFSIFLRVPWHFFILLFSNFLFFFLSVAVFNYLWEWLVVGTYPVYVRKTTLIDKSRIGELENCFSTWITRDWPWIKQELWDAKASELSWINLCFRLTNKSRIWELENCFNQW